MTPDHIKELSTAAPRTSQPSVFIQFETDDSSALTPPAVDSPRHWANPWAGSNSRKFGSPPLHDFIRKITLSQCGVDGSARQKRPTDPILSLQVVSTDQSNEW